MTIEETFKHCVANVKSKVEPLGVKVWLKYLGNCSVVMLYTTKQRPLGSDPVVIFGQFPEKGAKKAKGEGYALYHRDVFLGDFHGKSDDQIVSQTTKLFGNTHNLKRAADNCEPPFARLKRAKQAKFVKTPEDACEEIIQMGVQEMCLEVILDVTAQATKEIILQEQAEEQKNESVNTEYTEPVPNNCFVSSCGTETIVLHTQPHSYAFSPVFEDVVSPGTYVVDFVPDFSSPPGFSPTMLFNFPSEEGFDSPLQPRELFTSVFPSQICPVHVVCEPAQQHAQLPSAPLISTPTTTFNPMQSFAEYHRRHALKKVWGERNPEKKTLPTGSKGKPPKKVNVPTTTLHMAEFKHRKPCALYELLYKERGEVCPSMMLQDVTEKSQYLCEACRVIIHDTCHTLYHQYVAEEKLSLQLCTQVFIPPPPKHA